MPNKKDDGGPSATPEHYSLIFEGNKLGREILEDLVRRFARPLGGSGIDRVLNQAEDAGRRKVLDFIIDQMNRHNGVDDDETNKVSTEHDG